MRIHRKTWVAAVAALALSPPLLAADGGYSDGYGERGHHGGGTHQRYESGRYYRDDRYYRHDRDYREDRYYGEDRHDRDYREDRYYGEDRHDRYHGDDRGYRGHRNDRAHHRGPDDGHGYGPISHDGHWRFVYFNARADRQQALIRTGIDSGGLTRREAERLLDELHGIERVKRRFAADGVLSGEERQRLVERYDRLGERIARLRHNDQYRHRPAGYRGDRYRYEEPYRGRYGGRSYYGSDRDDDLWWH